MTETGTAPLTRLRAQTQRLAWAAPIGVVSAAAAAATYVAQSDPNQTGNYPTCPFLLVTGQYCPGCGSLRMIHALTQGDIVSAAGFNVLALVMLPILAFMFVRWTSVKWRLRPPPTTMAHPAWGWTVVVTVVVYWVIRNLPPTDFLAPGGW